MTLRDRISVTWNYGKVLFLTGAVYNLMCAGFQSGRFSYAFMVDAFILKAALTAIILFLVKLFRDRDAVFFYINLGLSPRRLVISTVLIDFLARAALMAIMYLIHGMFTPSVLTHAALITPVQFAGVFLGLKAAAFLDERRAKLIVMSVLIFSGIMIVLTNL